MKRRLLIFAATLATMSVVSCNKNTEITDSTNQKIELKRISRELDLIVGQDAVKDVQNISNFYNSELSGYNTTAIRLRCGNIAGLTDGLFASLPSTRSIDWSLTARNAEFYANPSSRKWEYVGEGNGDGIYLYFHDDMDRYCYVKINSRHDHIGERAASVELYLGEEKIAECSAECISSGITNLTARLSASYGPVNSQTVFSSNHGEYNVNEKVTISGRDIAICSINAGNVTFSPTTDVISSFTSVDAVINILDAINISVECKASIPDLFLTNWDKDYVDRLQEYIDKNVDVTVQFLNDGLSQAEIILKVNKVGAPLFGKVEVIPYIRFVGEEESHELSAYLNVSSCLPDIIRNIEDILGNIRVTY